MDRHNHAFFGSKAAMIFSTSYASDPFLYIRCIRKLNNGAWEKPSLNQGKNVKINIMEMVQIVNLLNRGTEVWSTVHQYNEIKTQILFKWDLQAESLWININDYSRNLKFPETEFLRLLMEHMLHEKIEQATSGKQQEQEAEETGQEQNATNQPTAEEPEEYDPGPPPEEYDPPAQRSNYQTANQVRQQQQTQQQPQRNQNREMPEVCSIIAKIKQERPRALLLSFEDGTEKWFPKSTIDEGYDVSVKTFQNFNIQTWILRKNSLTNLVQS